jgi:hypothetical protein
VLEIRSEAGDGLLGVVTRAQKAVLTETEDPIGVLGIEAELLTEDPVAAFGIEAAYGEHLGQGVVERLDVHFVTEAETPPERALLARIFGDFGGTDFTSVCLHRADGSRELLDATLHFSQKVRWWAECTALVADALNEKELEGCRAVVRALGVKHAVSGSTLELAKRQLRAPLGLDDQIAAFEAGVSQGLEVELYCATLPTTRSSRLVARPKDGFELICTLSRKLPAESTSAARDAVALRDFVSEELGLELGGRAWRVENAHGDRREHRPHGPMGDGRRLQWSINFGAKRR